MSLLAVYARNWIRPRAADIDLASRSSASQRRRLKVCLVAPLPPPYGGIAHWTTLVRGSAESQSEIALRIVDVAPRWREVTDLTIWKRVVIGGWQMIWRQLRAVLWNLVCGCRVIHIATAGQLSLHRDLAIIRLGRLLGVPTVYHIHFGRVPELALSRTREWDLICRAMRKAHTVVPIDAETERTIREQLPEVNVARIPNGIDLGNLPMAVPARPAGASPTVIYLGWVIPTKGIDELLQAWTELGATGWRLGIVGPVDQSYRDQLSRKHCVEDVEFHGERPHSEAMEILAGADIFVLPSHTEGFPNVVLEAMALGRPIIATAVGAIPEMLQGDCGIVVPTKDVASLRQALLIVMSDERSRVDMGRRAQLRVRNEYGMPAVFERLARTWRNASNR